MSLSQRIDNAAVSVCRPKPLHAGTLLMPQFESFSERCLLATCPRHSGLQRLLRWFSSGHRNTALSFFLIRSTLSVEVVYCY
jgi:hypothetical protein